MREKQGRRGKNHGTMYLMSIRPRYAYRIFTGIKKYELRRWFGLKPEPGDIIIVYASGNVRALIGEFRVGRVIYGDPEDVWNYIMSQEKHGVRREDKGYIEGSRAAMAIEVIEPRLYPEPVSLYKLRAIIPGFNPPMSFKILEPDDPLYRLVVEKLREMAKEKQEESK